MRQSGHFEEPLGVLADKRDGRPRDPAELPFLRNTWYVAGWATEFGAATAVGRSIVGELVVLYRKRDGTLVALEDRCAHRWAPLSFGRVEGDDLRCMYHGLKYGADGRCIEIPGQERIARSLCVRTYPVVERHCFAWIWMGDPARVDPDLIPDLGMLDQSWRRIYHGSLDYEANYALISDNLLDLSHIAFLHEKTLGRPVVTVSEDHLTPYFPGGAEAKPLDRGVRVDSWVSGPQARTVVLPSNVPDGDLWTRTDFLVPGVFISDDQMYPYGTAEACKGLAPGTERAALSDVMSIQALTPMTARKTRYFYSVGFRAADLEETESAAMWEIVTAAFSEDLRMIEAVQRTIDTYPGHRMAGIIADRGLVLFRNLMKKLIAGEAPARLKDVPGVAS